MAKVTWQGNGWNLDIDSATDIPLNGSALDQFTSCLVALAATISITRLDLKTVAGDLQLSWQAADGRSWTNIVRFVDDVRTEGGFEQSDFFTIAELICNRNLRDQVAGLVWQYGVTRIKARW